MDGGAREVRVQRGQPHPETGEQGIWIRTPYLGEFISEIKSEIPARGRRWVPDVEAWWVGDEWAGYATDLVVHHYGETIIEDEHGGVEYRDRSGPVARQEGLF